MILYLRGFGNNAGKVKLLKKAVFSVFFRFVKELANYSLYAKSITFITCHGFARTIRYRSVPADYPRDCKRIGQQRVIDPVNNILIYSCIRPWTVGNRVSC